MVGGDGSNDGLRFGLAAMVDLDLGLGFWKKKKKERMREYEAAVGGGWWAVMVAIWVSGRRLPSLIGSGFLGLLLFFVYLLLFPSSFFSLIYIYILFKTMLF